jgi:AbrB family looped-hinge helix DNA binding protein
MPVVRVNQHFRITLPVRLREQLHLVEGDLLEATVRENEIVLKPVTDIDRDIDAAITEGLHDYEDGQVVGPFTSIGEFKTAVDQA